MGEKKTVYAVSDGEYSDYRVHWLFEDRGDANSTAARVGGYVQEFDLYGPGSGNELTVRHEWIAAAVVNPVGQVDEDIRVYSYESFSDEELQKSSIREFPARNWCDPDGNIHTGTTYEVRVAAIDQEAARKAAKERASKIAAEIAEGRPPSLEW